MSAIYRKTTKGYAEIETRAHRLAPRLRSALILVDGKRSEADLAPLLLQPSQDTLATLLAQGFIEQVGTAGPLPGTAGAAAVRPGPAGGAGPAGLAPNPGPPSAVPLAQRQRDAVRWLTEQAGPVGEVVALKLERARTVDELRAAVLQAAQVINNTRGRPAAEAYVARFQDL
jgi:hypothetical protein